MVEKLNPPYHFGFVEEELCRGAYPKDLNFPYLKRLGLKSIVSLIPEQPNEDIVKFCSENNIKMLWIRVKKPKENIPVSYSKIVLCLQALINPENLPLYVHCLDGTVVTGIVLACLRKLQLWPVSVAMAEYIRYTSDEIPGSSERDFVMKFSSPIEIPLEYPKWLWKGISIKPNSDFEHPTIPCRFYGTEYFVPVPKEPHHHYLHLARKAAQSVNQNALSRNSDSLNDSPQSKSGHSQALPQQINTGSKSDNNASSNQSSLPSGSPFLSNERNSKSNDNENGDNFSMTVKALNLECFRH